MWNEDINNNLASIAEPSSRLVAHLQSRQEKKDAAKTKQKTPEVAQQIPPWIGAILPALAQAILVPTSQLAQQPSEPAASSPPDGVEGDDDKNLLIYCDWLAKKGFFSASGVEEVRKKLSAAGFGFDSLKTMTFGQFQALDIGEGSMERIKKHRKAWIRYRSDRTGGQNDRSDTDSTPDTLDIEEIDLSEV